MKQIRLKDRTEIINSCYYDCPIYDSEYYCCELTGNTIQKRDLIKPDPNKGFIMPDCPLEDYQEEGESK